VGIVRTLKGDDGKPYISLEDLIKEVEQVKKSKDKEDINIMDEKPDFIDIVLQTLHSMETEYYTRFLFKK